MNMGQLIFAGLVALLYAGPATAQDAEERHEELVHADLPLYGGEDEKWPKAFTDDDGGFGCASSVRFGDWSYRDAEGGDEARWYRFSNYGVFHCFAVVKEAPERTELGAASFRYAFFVPIGEARIDRRKIELWVLQMGGRPGSDYLLLAREPAKGMVTRFDVLQRKCPPSAIRDGGGIDILPTRYCAINSRNDLVALARAMGRLKPLGTITLEEGDADAPAPKVGASEP